MYLHYFLEGVCACVCVCVCQAIPVCICVVFPLICFCSWLLTARSFSSTQFEQWTQTKHKKIAPYVALNCVSNGNFLSLTLMHKLSAVEWLTFSQKSNHTPFIRFFLGRYFLERKACIFHILSASLLRDFW